MENICKKCKEIINKKNPKFIDINKINVGMKLKRWFETDYESTHGKYRPCDGFLLIRKIDDDLIYCSVDGGNYVDIRTRDYFTNHTEIFEIVDPNIEDA